MVVRAEVVATAVRLRLGSGIEFALAIGCTVQVISGPCADGLATLTAIRVRTGSGAGNGILLKSAEAIETAQAVGTVVLDKTGTVTEGQPVVTDIVPSTGVTDEDLLRVAASLEKLSEHPLGQAIVREGQARNLALLEVTTFRQSPGQGIAGKSEGVRHIAGNAAMLRAEKVEA